MSYYNRPTQLSNTINSIRQSIVGDYEIIVVDDASPEELICPEARVIRIDKKDKWYNSSAIPYNIGLKEARGDIIIIQNPECYHVGDILKYVYDNIGHGLYLSFGCYAINKQETEEFNEGESPTIRDAIFDRPYNNGWYNHSRHRPVAYHFCSAITRGDLDKIKGFDERYAMGICYEDDDFIRRIRRGNITVEIIDNPYVIHQYHPPYTYMKPNYMALHNINKKIFDSEANE